MTNRPTVIIIGAGLAGCYLALLLAKKGYSIHIFEKRPNPHSELFDEGKSFNVTLYYRGIEALKKVGLWEEIKKYAQIAEGNVAHYANGSSRYDRFDHSQEVLYTIHRTSLNKTLISTAQKHPRITITFNAECKGIDRYLKQLSIRNTTSGEVKQYKYLFMVGADGAYSAVRSAIQAGQQSHHKLTFSEWGYKEVSISPETVNALSLRTKATHTWPRHNSLFLGFPNADHSITLMLNLPLTGEDSFQTLKIRQNIQTYLKREFSDLLPIKENIITSIQKKPLGHFVTVKTAPWHYKDSIVLVGDAAHAVVPFYGQGMCAALEDCLTLVSYLTKYRNRERAFESYQTLRKRNTDILADLSIDNFIELRDKSRSEKYLIKDQIYTVLHNIFPKRCQPPLYVLIAHTSLSYTEAVELFTKQDKIARLLGIDIVIFFIMGLKRVINAVLKGVTSIKSYLNPIPVAEYYPIS